MWADLSEVGRIAATGGYQRAAYSSVDVELRTWFVQEARARNLRVEIDPVGNVFAWWDPPSPASAGPERKGILTGSHLDSVPDGGAYDGPLGVVSALAAVDLLRERGTQPQVPLGVAVFAEEEGSRFGRACLGSRLAVGALDWAVAREWRDAAGIALPDAMESAGLDVAALDAGALDVGALDPDGSDGSGGPGTGAPPRQLSEQISCFVELHVEQGRDLVDRGAAVGVASEIWPHGRFRFDFGGEANHAGTTRMADRRDPMLTFAMTALAANKQARLADARATFGRLQVEPNGTNAIPSLVTAWLDARCGSDEALVDLVAVVERQGAERAERDGTTLTVTAESVTGALHFDADLATRIAADHEGGDWPVIPTQAGHDAGILAAAGVPTAMLFVRNPTGVSHAPSEHADVADCLVGVSALADTLERLAR